MRRIAVLATALALLVPACGGEAETETFAPTPTATTASDSGSDLVEAVTSAILANQDRGFNDDAATCIGRGLVAEFGADGLADLGVTAEDPDLEGGSVFSTPETARRAVDVAMDCIDMADSLLSLLPADVTLLDETVECVATELQSDVFRDLFADLLVEGAPPTDIISDPAAQLPIATLLFECLTPEEILQVDDLLN
ncbi:MAG: hypothetical protein QNJ81_15965 [Acidimicrobiia bacterium]|nr:hypothetical protein [Acidimicrobiia bacterium]